MRRRAMMKAVGATMAVGSAGCMGGGEVIEEVQRSVRIDPGQFWSHKLPDVSSPGGSIQYVVRADRAFDVYFFGSGEDYETYRAIVRGESSDRTPTGHDGLSTTAIPMDDGEQYEASTKKGARQPVDVEGPYFFVVDHTDYAVGPKPGDPGEVLSPSIDLTLVRNRF